MYAIDFARLVCIYRKLSLLSHKKKKKKIESVLPSGRVVCFSFK